MSTVWPSYSTRIDGRVRRSCGSTEVHTRQLHPMVGTPIEVPLPSTVRIAFIFWLLLLIAWWHGSGRHCSRPGGGGCHRVGDLDPGHPQFKEHILQQCFFAVAEIALGLLLQY